MLAILAALLLFAWIFGFGVYHVTAFAIHVLLFLAIISLVLHFVRRGRTT